MSRVIVVTSGKGGVGKTTVCAYLGLNLAKKNYRVCVLDMDIGLNNLDVVMGVENEITFDSEIEEKDIPQDTLFNKFVNWFRIQTIRR